MPTGPLVHITVGKKYLFRQYPGNEDTMVDNMIKYWRERGGKKHSQNAAGISLLNIDSVFLLPKEKQKNAIKGMLTIVGVTQPSLWWLSLSASDALKISKQGTYTRIPQIPGRSPDNKSLSRIRGQQRVEEKSLPASFSSRWTSAASFQQTLKVESEVEHWLGSFGRGYHSQASNHSSKQ